MLHQLLYGSRYCAVEHFMNSAGENFYYCLILKKRKQDLLLVSFHKFSSVKDLAIHLKKQKHVFMVINTDKVLTKIKRDLKPSENKKGSTYFFPNLEKNDFFAESYFEGRYSFCSICRKDYVNNLLEEYKKEGIKVLDFSIGSWCLHSLLPFMNNSELYIHSQRIKITDGEIQEIKDADYLYEIYEINGIKVPNEYVVSLAAIIFYYSRAKLSSFFDVWKFKGILGDFLQKRLFEAGYKFLFTFFLLLLVVYFSLTHYYNRKIETAKQKIAEYNISPEYLKHIEEELLAKREIQKRMQNSFSNKAWVLNELASNVPVSTAFAIIDVCPLTAAPEENKVLLIAERTIIISGVTTNLEKLSEWIFHLRQKDWVRMAKIQKINKEKGDRLKFKLSIKITNEL